MTRDSVRTFAADLHIHTLLSPCGEVEMIPSLVVRAAELAGLDIIGIADHNSCENAGAVMEAAKGSGVKVLPGLEVQSLEGVHMLCLFDSLDQALCMQSEVYLTLPHLPNTVKLNDQQLIVDSDDEFVSYCRRPLSLPTSMDISEIYAKACGLDGLVIPSHIDRSGTGLCHVLGMMPDDPVFDGVEISANITPREASERFPSVGNLPMIMNSDAHWLDAVGSRRTVYHLARRSVEEIRMALRGENGRRVEQNA